LKTSVTEHQLIDQRHFILLDAILLHACCFAEFSLLAIAYHSILQHSLYFRQSISG